MKNGICLSAPNVQLKCKRCKGEQEICVIVTYLILENSRKEKSLGGNNTKTFAHFLPTQGNLFVT